MGTYSDFLRLNIRCFCALSLRDYMFIDVHNITTRQIAISTLAAICVEESLT